ncbi:GyrI-like domain-containing protein [Propionibacteriaceae bacterium Y1923]|uniref:GyrI-like domain-containing protein n=1 Tax=Aestuariimicrobium sp. Y1814 TaxID=3418742 RepID=UPI003C261DE4
MSAPKVDLRKSLDSYRARAGEFRTLVLPPMQYLMVDGHGDPNTSPAYAAALGTLYPLAYALKFASKNELGRDYVVPPLEGLWWSDDMDSFTTARDKSAWDWTMMIMVPDWLGAEEVAAARAKIAAKARGEEHSADVRFATLDEGLCVQTLHLGPYDDEGPVLARMHHEFIPENGLVMTGSHHEVYLGDHRRVAPEKLRTLLRQPVVPAS